MSDTVYAAMLMTVKNMQEAGLPYREDWQARAAAIDWEALAHHNGKQGMIEVMRQCLERD